MSDERGKEERWWVQRYEPRFADEPTRIVGIIGANPVNEGAWIEVVRASALESTQAELDEARAERDGFRRVADNDLEDRDLALARAETAERDRDEWKADYDILVEQHFALCESADLQTEAAQARVSEQYHEYLDTLSAYRDKIVAATRERDEARADAQQADLFRQESAMREGAAIRRAEAAEADWERLRKSSAADLDAEARLSVGWKERAETAESQLSTALQENERLRSALGKVRDKQGSPHNIAVEALAVRAARSNDSKIVSKDHSGDTQERVEP